MQVFESVRPCAVIHLAPEILLISKNVWDRLSPDEQKIFRGAARASVPYMRKLWDAKEAASRAIVAALMLVTYVPAFSLALPNLFLK